MAKMSPCERQLNSGSCHLSRGVGFLAGCPFDRGFAFLLNNFYKNDQFNMKYCDITSDALRHLRTDISQYVHLTQKSFMDNR